MARTRAGRISYWPLFYAQDFLTRNGILINADLFEADAAAWSSADPQEVAAFYAPLAGCQDALFGDFAQGSDAILAYAVDFFSWHPNASLELLE